MTSDHATAERKSWNRVYRAGGLVAFIALGGMLLDIALTMLPGWGAGSVPTTAQAWLAQFAEQPVLGMRNLDFLNIMLSVLSLPMYVALYGAHRRREPALALLGLLVVALGTALFVSANAGLPMLELSRAVASGAASPSVAQAAALSLLTRGAHGSAGAYPGFLLSELGTLAMAGAMLAGGVFPRRVGVVGIAGVAILIAYTTAYTFAPGSESLITFVAIPGGLAMIAWHFMVGRALLKLDEFA